MTCEQCGGKLVVRADRAGRRIACPKCLMIHLVPSEPEAMRTPGPGIHATSSPEGGVYSDRDDPAECAAAVVPEEAPRRRFLPTWVASGVAHALVLFLLFQVTFQSPQPGPAETPPMQVNVAPLREEPPTKPAQNLVDEPVPEANIAEFAMPEMDMPEPEVPAPVFAKLPATPLEDPLDVGTKDGDESLKNLLASGDLIKSLLTEKSDRPRVALDGTNVPFAGDGGLLGNRSSIGQAKAGRFGMTQASQSAVMAGLAWLAKAQESDGHWEIRKWEGSHDCVLSVTGLALLCFLGAGYTADGGAYRDTVANALDWIIRNQDPETGRLNYTVFYSQGIASLALCEAVAMADKKNSTSATERVREAAQKAVYHICQSQDTEGGFGYQGPGKDVSISHWQFMALKSAQVAGLHVPPDTIDRAKTFLTASFNYDGSSDYQADGNPARSNAIGQTTSPAGLMCRLFLGWERDDEDVLKAAAYVRRQGTMLGSRRTDLYSLYVATLGMFQLGGPYWSQWNAAFRDRLIGMQVKQGDLKGSWSPKQDAYGRIAGRVFTTSLAVLSLEVYYRYAPMYLKEDGGTNENGKLAGATKEHAPQAPKESTRPRKKGKGTASPRQPSDPRFAP